MVDTTTKPVLLLHNGNSRVKNNLADKFGARAVPCISCFDSINNKIEFLVNNPGTITDLTSADQISNLELFELKNYCTIIKVITSFDDDLNNLEDVVDVATHTKLDWLRFTSTRLWAADKIYWDNFSSIDCNTHERPIIFTTGRSGTNVLASILNLSYLHHDNDILASDKFYQLKNSAHIHSVVRKDFLSLFASSIIGKKLGIILTTESTLSAVNTRIARATPFNISEVDINEAADMFINFVDLLLLLKILFNKKISVVEYENLKSYFDNIKYKKNPYLYEDLILNLGEFNDCVAIKYQPFYKHASNQIFKYCGITLL